MYTETLIANDQSQYYPAVLASLFSRSPRPTGEFLYDYNFPETSILRDAVIENLKNLFKLHGARDVDVPLLMPLTDKHLETTRQVLLLDQHGEIVTLPSNALLPFARLAARHKTTRIKRYHIGDMYRIGAALAHPSVSSAAIMDIITPDTSAGLHAASAEMITLMDECMSTFPNLAKTYQIHVSHSKSKHREFPETGSGKFNYSNSLGHRLRTSAGEVKRAGRGCTSRVSSFVRSETRVFAAKGSI